jgi:hypothetical protein
MNDPFGSFQNFMGQFQNFMKNPGQMMHNIPQDIQNNPNEIIKYMMNNGMINQQQYNKASAMAKTIQNNPMFSQFMK